MDSDLKVSVSAYSTILEGKKDVQYYTIDVSYRGKKWSVNRRFKEFSEMNTFLMSLYPDLPKCPPKTLFALSKAADIEKRRIELDNYLQGVCKRREVCTNESLIKFLKIDENNKKSMPNQVSFLGKHSHPLFGVRSFYYLPKKKIMFTVNSDMSVASRLDSYVSNIKSPFEKEDSPYFVSVGSLDCYTQVGIENFSFEKIWTRTFPVQAICTDFNESKSLLFVGLDDGCVVGISVPPSNNFLQFEEVIRMKVHKARVMGVYVDAGNDMFYTVSEDKTLKMTNYKTKVVIQEITVSMSKLTELQVEKTNRRVLVTDRSGQVLIYSLKSDKMEKIHSVQTDSSKSLRGLYSDPEKFLCFTVCYEDGLLHTINLGPPGQESSAKKLKYSRTKPKARVVFYSQKRAEVYVGNEDGTIFIFNVADMEAPIYVFKAHSEDVCDIKTYDDLGLMITASKDKSTRFWLLPKSFNLTVGSEGSSVAETKDLSKSSNPISQSQYSAPKPNAAPSKLDKDNEFGNSDSDSDEPPLFKASASIKTKKEEPKPYTPAPSASEKKSEPAPPPMPISFGRKDSSDEEDLDGWDH